MSIAKPGDIARVHVRQQGLVLSAQGVVIGLKLVMRGDHGDEQIAELNVARDRREIVQADDGAAERVVG